MRSSAVSFGVERAVVVHINSSSIAKSRLSKLSGIANIDYFTTAQDEQSERSAMVLTANRAKDLKVIAQELRTEKGVESVYVPRSLTCPSNPRVEPFFLEGRHNALQDMGIPEMWDLPGGKGERVQIADLEFGWYDHPDLNGLRRQLTPKTQGVETDSSGVNRASHGTQTMTVVGARANGTGMTGVVPELSKLFLSGIHSMTDSNRLVQHTPWAVRSAADSLNPGDVLLIEVSLANGEPLEFEHPNVRNEIARAIGKGIVVIAAAGNKSRELNTSLNAIHVGAGWKLLGGPGIDPNSNRGASIDCFAWGQGVVSGIRAGASAQPGWGTFKNTSAAAALVAGLVAGVQSVRKTAGKAPLSHLQVKALLRTPGLGSQPVSGIGTMPHAGRMCSQALAMP